MLTVSATRFVEYSKEYSAKRNQNTLARRNPDRGMKTLANGEDVVVRQVDLTSSGQFPGSYIVRVWTVSVNFSSVYTSIRQYGNATRVDLVQLMSSLHACR